VSLHSLRALAPYIAMEVFLPGGSLIALATWLCRRNRRRIEERHAMVTLIRRQNSDLL
jgi:hypothetical protein